MKNLRNSYYLETADTDDQELKIRTPPKRHSPEKLANNEEYDVLYEFLVALRIQEEFEKFHKNEIAFCDLELLNQEDLEEIGISFRSAKRIIEGVSLLKENSRSSLANIQVKKYKKKQNHTFKYEKLNKDLKNIVNKMHIISDAIHDQQIEIIDLYQDIV